MLAGCTLAGRFVVRGAFSLTGLTLLLVGCSLPDPEPRRTAFQVEKDNVAVKYDPASGKLHRLEIDRDRNGTKETVSVWDGSRLLHIEIDGNDDGRVDRWEHYDGASTISRVGASSRDDGIEDLWLFSSVDRSFVARIERDVNRDGKVEKWEEYGEPTIAGGPPVLVKIGMDPEGTGRPTHWMVYRSDGSLERTEVP